LRVATVQIVANRYGTSTAFVITALGRLGFAGAALETPVPLAFLEEFEKVFGDRIRAAKSKEGTPAPSPARREPPRHVLRVAHEKVTGQRNPVTWQRERVLAEPPGLAHAIDPMGTRDGDPWKGRRVDGHIDIYDGAGPFAACGVRVKALVSDEFNVDRADACPRCAEAVDEGRALRSEPRNRPNGCGDYLRLSNNGRILVEQRASRVDFSNTSPAARGRIYRGPSALIVVIRTPAMSVSAARV
jgi:hypothetical protein